MLQIVPQLKILLCYEAVDFRRGIDRPAAVCRDEFGQDPYCGAVFVFRNRRGTAVKLLAFDGIGFYLVLRRFSRGVLRWRPRKTGEPLTRLAAQQLQILLYQGSPDGAKLAEDWRRLPLP